MKNTVTHWLSLIAKGASLVAGLAAYGNLIPAKYSALAVIVFGLASVAKDTANRAQAVIENKDTP